jgi:cysteine desulfurase
MIYADYNATTPCTAEHLEKVTKMILECDGNPSSIHAQGRRAKTALESARREVSWHFGAEPSEIIFMSGATEVNNLVLQGVSCNVLYPEKCVGEAVKSFHVVISAGEHPSINAACEILKKRCHAKISTVPLLRSGVISSEGLEACIDPSTTLVSLIYVNNETGIVSDIESLVHVIRKVNPTCHIHIDAVQAFGKVDLKWIGKSSIDSAVISGHKVGGLKGSAALFLKKSSQLGKVIVGGGQERGKRAGTENMPGIFSLGIRARELRDAPNWMGHVPELWKDLWDRLSKIKGLVLHGDPQHSTFNTVNFHVDSIPGELIMFSLDGQGISVSMGSACSSGVAKPSQVLTAMGYSDVEASNSIRISLGFNSKREDIDSIVETLQKILAKHQLAG